MFPLRKNINTRLEIRKSNYQNEKVLTLKK